MKNIIHVVLMIAMTFASQVIHAGTPLVEFISKPNPNQQLKAQNTSILYYSLRNNTSLNLPLSYSFSNAGARVASSGNTCGQSIAAHSSCVLPIQYQAPASNENVDLIVRVDFQGRAPLIDVVHFTIDSTLACVLLDTASYQTPFCQSQYQKVLHYSAGVFNVSGQDVQEEQSLGGVFGIYQNINNSETICYISCGLRALNGTAPNEHTLFELASVTKTLTTSIFGKLIHKNQINPFDAASSELPAGFSLSVNESPVTFQQLATFSGGVCYSDAPSVVQNSGNQVQNQANFITDINNLNPDPSTLCADGKSNVNPEYGSPQYLPSHNRYSNSSVGLLGQALMNFDGYTVLEPGFNNWMCTNITNVLGMTRTNGCLPDAAQNGTCNPSDCTYQSSWTTSEYASPYHITQHAYELGNPFPFLPWAPAGGIRSNAVDMVNYLRANLGFRTNNTPDQVDLIAGMQLAQQPNNYLPAPGTARLNIGSQSPIVGPQGYAWVCMLSPTNGDNLCGKIGGHANFRSFVGLNKSQNYAVVILLNTGAASTNGGFLPPSPIPTVGQIGTDLMENIS